LKDKVISFEMQTGTGYTDLAKWLHSADRANSFVIHPPKIKPGNHLPASRGAGKIGVYSSGSTGKPKLIWWNLEALNAICSKHSNTSGWTWATCYQPWSFAGVHLACQAHVSKGQVLQLGRDWELNHTILQHNKPQALSATPTFIDLLIQSRHTSKETDWSPQQITIGGEILRPATGARIQSAYPSSRITLIYASAEIGLIAKTSRHDGWFPLDSIKQRFEDFKLIEDELYLERQGIWIPTRDLCEIKGDHFRLMGRLDRVLNIGGDKVCLDEIESIAESFPEVRRANANAKPNAIVGQVVALDLEPAVPEADDTLLDSIMQKMRKQLPKPAWPRWCQWGEVRDMANGKRTHDTGAKKT
jgi:acyl-coenzyme A synthetase/AMP-(fatty) acid ligase